MTEIPATKIEDETIQATDSETEENTDDVPEYAELWAQGCAASVESMLKQLQKEKKLSEPIVDSGAGVGRHVRAALEAGATNIYAVERHPPSAQYIKKMVKALQASDRVTVVEGDAVEELQSHPDGSVAAIIDIGMTHCLSAQRKRVFWELVHSKLRRGGLYAILHWSEMEVLGTREQGSDVEGGLSLETLRQIFTPDRWEQVQSWRVDSWPAQQDKSPEINETHHHACQGLLRKK